MKKIALCLILLSGCATDQGSRQWLAGDHHIHSQFSVGWDNSNPPKPIVGGDAAYTITKNAEMARKFGLDWMVSTDHGGPNHSKVNLEQAYPEILRARDAVPEVIQFVGLELNTPGADHSSIIVPHDEHESEHLHEYESQFDVREPWPNDGSRNNEDLMLEALAFVDQWEKKPVVIAHHPSRSATGLDRYGATSPAELRRWNDTAPDVAVGMEGAPGHQAAVFKKGIGIQNFPPWVLARGAYGRGHPTMGGFDQMTAKLGGFWDSMLGEGRRWWITANSDSHVHYTEGGIDFWPGEYSKTYVYAQKSHDSILRGIREGRIFVTTGDLITELYVTVESKSNSASIGEEIVTKSGDTVTVNIRARDPVAVNVSGDRPTVERVDLIIGKVGEKSSDTSLNNNPSTQVVKRFESWTRDGEYLSMYHTLRVDQNSYIRVRGTNNLEELEPKADDHGEDPWTDLWFYSNPIFIKVM